jgi:hypothetical protein
VWVAALGPNDSDDGAYSFVRVAICLMGALGCLEGFPVAGSQMLWAALTLVPVGVMCITDGLSMTPQLNRGLRWAVGGAMEASLGSLVAMALVLVLVFGNVREVVGQWRTRYYANVPVTLLGAHRVRLPLAQERELRLVTEFLTTNCSTYWSLPGLNSFYLLSGETPPTDLNVTQDWWTALSIRQQDRVLARLRDTPRLCLIENPYFGYKSFYGVHVFQSPLVRYLEADFVVARMIGGDYHLLVRRSSTTTP